jgi:hypothetical protein
VNPAPKECFRWVTCTTTLQQNCLHGDPSHYTCAARAPSTVVSTFHKTRNRQGRDSASNHMLQPACCIPLCSKRHPPFTFLLKSSWPHLNQFLIPTSHSARTSSEKSGCRILVCVFYLTLCLRRPVHTPREHIYCATHHLILP